MNDWAQMVQRTRPSLSWLRVNIDHFVVGMRERPAAVVSTANLLLKYAVWMHIDVSYGQRYVCVTYINRPISLD